MMETTALSHLEELPDDILSHLFIFCDFGSAFTLATRTNLVLKKRSEGVGLHHVWRDIFHRHNFSPLEGGDDDFMKHCQRRRVLFHNLLKNERTQHYYKMPDRFFSFHSILSNNNELEKEAKGTFSSFALTSTATSPEIVLVDPFDKCVSVIADYLKRPRLRETLLGSDEKTQLDIDHSQFQFVNAGTESKSIIKPSSNAVVGKMVWTGRFVLTAQNNDIFCTEILAWTKANDDSYYKDRMACYIPGTFTLADVDAKNQQVFASFHDLDDPRSLRANRRPRKDQILVYPMEFQTNDKRKDFSTPKMTIECQYPISAFSIDATGESLAVATARGTLEIWNVTSNAQRLETIHIRPALKASIQGRLEALRKAKLNGRKINDRETNDPCILRNQLEQLSAAPIESIILPKHLPMDQCGFVTTHKGGRTLLLWKKSRGGGNYEIVSLINLPLSSKRIPQVKYDGSRILVFGENDDGGTILVYHVGCSDMPIKSKRNDFPTGGLHNLTYPANVGFANQIGHRIIEDVKDFMHMECNERFIMIKTTAKAGLLVIDLDDSNV